MTITDLYAALAKPVWAPPGWLFGPVWTTLYISMSLAMWLVWKQRFEMAGRYAVARGLWWVQLLLNAAWPVFFWMHPAGFLPFLVCGTLFLCVCFCVVRFWPLSVAAATLMLPYAVWSGFATALSCALWLLNRAG